MPRIARGLSDGFVFHILNRGNGRQEVFHKDGDYHSFLTLIKEAVGESDITVLAYCLMPNHFHFLLQPDKAEKLSKFMQWLMTSHVRRYHQHYGTSGHVWQGRYKSFIVQEDDHLLTVMRYIERKDMGTGFESLKPVAQPRPWTRTADAAGQGRPRWPLRYCIFWRL